MFCTAFVKVSSNAAVSRVVSRSRYVWHPNKQHDSKPHRDDTTIRKRRKISRMHVVLLLSSLPFFPSLFFLILLISFFISFFSFFFSYSSSSLVSYFQLFNTNPVLKCPRTTSSQPSSTEVVLFNVLSYCLITFYARHTRNLTGRLS